MSDVLYRCGLPVAMGALAAGALITVAAAALAITVAGQVLLGVGKYGRHARAYGLHGWRR